MIENSLKNLQEEKRQIAHTDLSTTIFKDSLKKNNRKTSRSKSAGSSSGYVFDFLHIHQPSRTSWTLSTSDLNTSFPLFSSMTATKSKFAPWERLKFAADRNVLSSDIHAFPEQISSKSSFLLQSVLKEQCLEFFSSCLSSSVSPHCNSEGVSPSFSVSLVSIAILFPWNSLKTVDN